jgi:hypothetical protein
MAISRGFIPEKSVGVIVDIALADEIVRYVGQSFILLSEVRQQKSLSHQVLWRCMPPLC